jgi:hypothetical protein
MMKLKANPKDTALVKRQRQEGRAVAASAKAAPAPMSPFQEHQIYPSKSLDLSLADGIDSTAPGLNESVISVGSETIDSMEEKKIDHSFSHYDSKQLAALRTAHFSVEANNYRARHDANQHEQQQQPNQQRQQQTQMLQSVENQEQRASNRHAQMQVIEQQQHNTSQQQWNDPWSSDPWNDTFWSASSSKQSHDSPNLPHETPDASFDTLQFQPSIGPFPRNSAAKDLFDVGFASPSDATWGGTSSAFASTTINTTGDSKTTTTARRRNHAKVNVAVQERLSILFDETAKGPICRVVGSIFVQPPALSPCPALYSFCLTIRDKKGNIEQWDESLKSKCENITASVPHDAVDPGDQVFMVSLRAGEPLEAPIVRYACISRLRPMPMLLKTKVHKKGINCRVGLRLRSNPQNQYILTDIAVLMIVPLDMDGSSLSMSRKDGVWDEMKRTLTWTIQELPPGELIDIQAQFKVLAGVSSGDASSKFPILARCNGKTSFSRIDVNSDCTVEGAIPVDIEVSRSTNVLYRKV